MTSRNSKHSSTPSASTNHARPHKSLPHRATPTILFDTIPKATPTSSRDHDSHDHNSHDHVRTDRVDKSGKITLRHRGCLYSIGIGRTHARTRVVVLAHDLQIGIINRAADELLRELTLDENRRYQPLRQHSQTHK